MATSDHPGAGPAAGFELTEMQECFVDEDRIKAKPKWEPYRSRPVSFAMAWRKKAF
jgi:hypothetical protein